MEYTGTQVKFTTTDATPTTKGLMGIPENCCFTGQVYVKGITAAGDMCIWEATIFARRKASAAVQFQLAQPLPAMKDTALTSAAVALQGSADLLNVQVTGVAGQTITWYLSHSGDINA